MTTLDLTSFTPIADILILERRMCRKCGFGSHQPSGIYRLWTSHEGPHRHALVRRKAEELPLPTRALHTVETSVEACALCFRGNSTWEEACSIAPEAPLGAAATGAHMNGFSSIANKRLLENVGANALHASREARERVHVALAKPRRTLTLADLCT